MTDAGDANFDHLVGTKDGRSWRIGGQNEIAWIARATPCGLEITAAIPPIFESYATVVIPEGGTCEGDRERAVQDTTLVAVLAELSAGQAWWLGYLQMGGRTDIVFPSAPMVGLYGASWRYVLVEAGPDQAAGWRSGAGSESPLPDLIFPTDRSWLVSKLWDDDWRCIGGSRAFITRVLQELRPNARQVELGQDATPPGHVAR